MSETVTVPSKSLEPRRSGQGVIAVVHYGRQALKLSLGKDKQNVWGTQSRQELNCVVGLGKRKEKSIVNEMRFVLDFACCP